MTGSTIKLLVIDDEPAIRRLLRTGLATQGYLVQEAESVRQAERNIAVDPPELIILDLGLPDEPGLELLRRLRKAGVSTPVVILSSRTDENGIVQALELGADDYVGKPFGMNELIARIRVALRHKLHTQGEKPVFQVGDLSVDLVRRIVKLRGEELKLSPREYDILRVLVQHAGKVLTHQFIIRQVWGGGMDVQNLRVHVRQIRQKIEPDPERPFYILTETGVGYRLKADDGV